jgi:aspartate/methionine/tyrosine aminotransferase
MKPAAASAIRLPRSAIRVLFDAADRRPDTLRLEVGEPSFTTPTHIIDAAHEAAGRALADPEVQKYQELFEGRVREVRDLRGYSS